MNACEDCGMAHEPGDKDARLVGHGDDPVEIQVTIHSKYGDGPMPVEFRDAMVELVRCVKQAIDDGTLPKRRAGPPGQGGE